MKPGLFSQMFPESYIWKVLLEPRKKTWFSVFLCWAHLILPHSISKLWLLQPLIPSRLLSSRYSNICQTMTFPAIWTESPITACEDPNLWSRTVVAKTQSLPCSLGDLVVSPFQTETVCYNQFSTTQGPIPPISP